MLVLDLRGNSRSEVRAKVPRRLLANEGRSPISEEREGDILAIGDGRGDRKWVGRSETERARRDVVSSACSLEGIGLDKEVERRRGDGREGQGDAGRVGTGDGIGEGLRLCDRGEGMGDVE